MHTHTHIYTNIYTHTYIHTHTQTKVFVEQPLALPGSAKIKYIIELVFIYCVLPHRQIYIGDRFQAIPSLDADLSSYCLVLQVPGRQEPLVGRHLGQALQHG